jgi:hypothetical protein
MTQRTQFLEGWLASEQAALDVITVKRVYIDINDGNLHDGLLFSQIMYWHGNSKETGKPRMTITRDGELWLAKSYTDWWDECRINEHTARKSINRIAERKLIITNLWKFDGAPTVHLRIDWQEFESRVKSIWHSVSNPTDTTGQLETTPQVNSLTETTATPTPTKTQKPNGAVPSANKDLTDIIQVWLKNNGMKDLPVHYKNKGYREKADTLIAMWISASDLDAYMCEARKTWAKDGRPITWQNAIEHIETWKATHSNGNGRKYNAQQQILIAEQAAKHNLSVEDYLAHVEAMQK